MKKFKNYGDISPPITLLSKNLLSKIALVSIFSLTVSCSNDDNNGDIESTVDKESVSDFSTSSYSEEKKKLLEDGWILLENKADSTKINDDFNNNQPLKEARNNRSRSLPITRQLLLQMGYNVDSPPGRRKFTQLFTTNNVVPDGVRMTEQYCVGSCNEANKVGTANARLLINAPIITRKTIPLTTTRHNEVIPNQLDYSITTAPNYNYSLGERITKRTISSTTIKLTAAINFGIPLIGKIGGVEVSYGKTNEDTQEGSIEIKVGNTNSIEVRRRSKIHVRIIARGSREIIDYRIPATIVGNVRTNFPRRANGSFFWSRPLDSYPNFMKTAHTLKDEQGQITSEIHFSPDIFISPEMPVDMPYDPNENLTAHQIRIKVAEYKRRNPGA